VLAEIITYCIDEGYDGEDATNRENDGRDKHKKRRYEHQGSNFTFSGCPIGRIQLNYFPRKETPAVHLGYILKCIRQTSRFDLDRSTTHFANNVFPEEETQKIPETNRDVPVSELAALEEAPADSSAL